MQRKKVSQKNVAVIKHGKRNRGYMLKAEDSTFNDPGEGETLPPPRPDQSVAFFRLALHA